MKYGFLYHAFLILSMVASLSFCNKQQENNFSSITPNGASRIWIGPEYWANPLQDWQLNNGKIECITSGGFRSIYLLTHEIGAHKGSFSMSVRAENINMDNKSVTEGWIGFEIGINGEFNDYRDNAIRGRGFPVGITTNGQPFIGNLALKEKSISGTLSDEIIIRINAIQQNDGNYTISMEVQNSVSPQTIQRKDIPAKWIEGGIALMCHSGSLKSFQDETKLNAFPEWKKGQNTKRSGNVKFGFSDWEIEGDKIDVHKNQAFGPILFAQYTLSNQILKLTAQMPPIGNNDGQNVAFQTNSNGDWTTVSQADIDPFARTATFKIEEWDASTDTPYRLAYQLFGEGDKLKDYYYEGTIRKEPLDKNEIIVAGFTGNNDLGFPNTDIFNSIKYHNPDVLFFSGDQLYQGVAGYGVQEEPVEKAYIDYLRKWYLYGWAYGDLMCNRPTVAIPDDHDVYHGNIWGAGGISAYDEEKGTRSQDNGGYKMPPNWVNMVQRTQTSHLPDAFDPTPVKQGIGVYYTDMRYGGVSFAILEDRKFKSAPKPMLPEAKISNGWARNVNYNAAANSDIEGAKLLGNRQLNFLEEWSSDWSGNTWMKVVLSQTIFANVATLPYEDSHSDAIVPRLRILEKGAYPDDDVPVSDFDSNSWPQTGRDNAVKAIRKSFAFHYAGDQHLGSTIQYGVDEWHDAGYAFCVPSISNFWPRRWYPIEGGKNRNKDAPKYTGDFLDGFGNEMSVSAISNPVFTGKKPAKLYDRAAGYGIVRFNKKSRDITIECWPRQANPEKDAQYPGWPIVINQEDNFLSNATLFLPELKITGMENPVVQVISEDVSEIVYTIRINGQNFQPKVLKEGYYTIKVGEPGTQLEKTVVHIHSGGKKLDSMNIDF